MNEILVLKCGLLVKPKLHNAEGIITAISIRFGKVTYEISYFHNGEYKTIWMSGEEFDVAESEKMKVGFTVSK